MKKILLAVLIMVLAMGLCGGTCVPENMILEEIEIIIPIIDDPIIDDPDPEDPIIEDPEDPIIDDPDVEPSAIVIITDWTQGSYGEPEEVHWYPWVTVYYTFENTGLETINFFRIWVIVICVDGTQIIDCSDWMDLFVPAGVIVECKFPYAGQYYVEGEVSDVELDFCEISYPY